MDERLITADDVVRAGACRSGVEAAITRLSKKTTVAAAMPASVLLRLVTRSEKKYVSRAAELNGDGSGDGYGDGDGYGSGYGSGYGDGSGDGYGSGSGYGSGYGYGDGYGDGNGDGDGYGGSQ